MRKISRLALGLAALVGAAGPARAEWWEATTDHFVVYSESNRADTERFINELDRFDGALRTLQNMPVGGDVGRANKVTVFRSGDPDFIGQLAGQYGVYGFYMARAGGPVAFAPAREERQSGTRHYESDVEALKPMEVLKHEYTHHFMLRFVATTYPDWYVEGYAELMATLRVNDDGSFHVGDVPNYRGEALRVLNLVPAERFFDNKRKRGFNDFRMHYAQGWLVSHYLSFSPKRAGQLDAYLKALTKGENSIEAAKRIFGDLNALDKELAKYIKTKNRPGINVVPGNYVAPKITMRRLSRDEESLMKAKIRISRGVTRNQAEGYHADLKGLGTWTNESAAAQLLIAEAALDSRRYAEADKAADRALALDPSSDKALIFKARALSESKDTDGMGDRTRFAKARSLLIKARKLDENNPESLIRYYETFENSGEPLTEQGRLVLDVAYPLASFDASYRIVLGRVLLGENRLSDARNVLMPVAFSAHRGDPEKNPMTKVAQAIEADDLPAAKAAMDELWKKQKEAEAKE